jgi:hypothetical protein
MQEWRLAIILNDGVGKYDTRGLTPCRSTMIRHRSLSFHVDNDTISSSVFPRAFISLSRIWCTRPPLDSLLIGRRPRQFWPSVSRLSVSLSVKRAPVLYVWWLYCRVHNPIAALILYDPLPGLPTDSGYGDLGKHAVAS